MLEGAKEAADEASCRRFYYKTVPKTVISEAAATQDELCRVESAIPQVSSRTAIGPGESIYLTAHYPATTFSPANI
jgi:hypothetical protein